MEGMDMICPYCRSQDIRKDGFYRYNNKVEQRYECKECEKHFEKSTGSPFHRMRNKSNVIIHALKLYVLYPISADEVAKIIWGIYRVRITGKTILEWVYKFRPHFSKLPKFYKPKYSKIWHIDEMFVNSKGSEKRKGTQMHLFTVYDSKRNVIATLLSEKRDIESANKVIELAVEEAGFIPDIVATDGCEIHQKAIRWVSRKIRHVEAHFETKIISHKTAGIQFINQNRIERYHAEIRPKENGMRGIKSAERGTAFFQMYGVFHNFLREHMTFGMTPAKYSGVDEDINWDNLAVLLEICCKAG